MFYKDKLNKQLCQIVEELERRDGFMVKIKAIGARARDEYKKDFWQGLQSGAFVTNLVKNGMKGIPND